MTQATQVPAVPVAIAPDALLAKSKQFARRALKAKASGDEDEYQLWAALALELVAKASLATIHPSLVVDAANPNSLLEANGVSTGTAVRTIDANVVFARLKHTVPHFGTPVAEACKNLTSRRNAELHSGHAAMTGIPMESWEGDFWAAAQLILESMDMDLDDWVGREASAAKKLVAEVRHIKKEAAKKRITHAAAMFDEKHDKKQREALREASKGIKPYEHVKRFRYTLDTYWSEVCPACKSMAIMGGDRVDEEIIKDESQEPGWQTIRVYYAPAELFCPTCALSLVGEEALEAAALDQGFDEEEEREIEYEGDYGND